ncbi:hypothetical protein ASPZODRAFT_135945 [Penicilliopsis zonata CBS 506.65]|uniref:Uncharacterized protein n=1 Tax=Penicilliopsis zonata CBS 506.65 TaxID=1073090 RepID=A0A1L9S9S0_9EURO|nr:hypothetical protein ASPZODRAFT_135945 [Penicilliopsis zonata CBS 506.65]OJJ43904.1 hypothetical protein ASPZODRAFT_135945 [Penicilliopsis zonata CBS 506.65]
MTRHCPCCLSVSTAFSSRLGVSPKSHSDCSVAMSASINRNGVTSCQVTESPMWRTEEADHSEKNDIYHIGEAKLRTCTIVPNVELQEVIRNWLDTNRQS